MAKRNYTTVETRLRGSQNPIKLDVNECRIIGKETKRLLKSGMRLNDAKQKAIYNVKGIQ